MITPRPITAWSAVTGLGRTVDEMRAGLQQGRDGLRPCPIELPFSTVVGWVDGELPEMPAGRERYGSRLARLALAAYEPLGDAVRRACRRWGVERVALIASTSTGGIAETESAYFAWRDQGAVPEEYDFEGQHVFGAFTEVLRTASGISGPCYVVSTACSSSGKVFASARRLIDAGIIDAALVGGVDALCLTTLRGFHSLGVLASEPCRPFGADRPGMNIGEGAAFVLIEREGDAPARLLGVGESSDAFHMSAPHPDGSGALAAMRDALREGGLEPAQVDHVNAHGTGTTANDVAEARAIGALFGDRVPVVSTKSYTGHTLGAAGATEAVIALSCLGRGYVPESLRATPLDPSVGVNVCTEGVERPLSVVLSNSFAFGGNNVAVLFGGPA